MRRSREILRAWSTYNAQARARARASALKAFRQCPPSGARCGSRCSRVLTVIASATGSRIAAVRAWVRWGVDVLNMSFTMRAPSELAFYWFGAGEMWDETFRFAAREGLVMVAAAGNQATRIPEDASIGPATRTEGVITVGALAANAGGPGAMPGKRPSSNFGGSVDIWAPGSNVPVEGMPEFPNGRLVSGTSIAAPLVSGVAAMLRALNPTLTSADIRDRLIRNGWKGAGDVTAGLDAYATLLDVMGGELPQDGSEARGPIPLIRPGGAPRFVLPKGRALLSGKNDRIDQWLLRVSDPKATVTLEWYKRIANVALNITPHEPTGAQVNTLTSAGGAGRTVTTADLSPGDYTLSVRGVQPTAYELVAETAPILITTDGWEPNNSFEQATCINWKPVWINAFGTGISRCLGPGGHLLTLHNRPFAPIGTPIGMDVDFFSTRRRSRGR